MTIPALPAPEQGNIYGSYSRASFLGCSVANFSGNLGLNDQESQFGLTLVEDATNGDSFTQPNVGTPQIFTYNNFTFGGLFSSHTRGFSSDGNPIIRVNLTDVRALLDGCQVILSGYTGGFGVTNIFNVYGTLESAGGFGASGNTEGGMLWDAIRNTLPGLVVLNGIHFNGFRYILDIAEVPYLPGYRFSGTNESILSLIKEVCFICNLDLYFTLSLIDGIYVISARTISRVFQPDLSIINNYIADGSNAESSERGIEMRNDTVAAVITGGNVVSIQEVFFAQDRFLPGKIWPYWGLDENGNVIIGTEFNDNHKFTVDLTTLGIKGIGQYEITVAELRAALGGQESWLAYLVFQKPAEAKACGVTDQKCPLDFKVFLGNPADIDINKLHNLKGDALNLFNQWWNDDKQLRKVDTLWQVINEYATTYYGTKFIISLSDIVTAKIDPDTQQPIYSFDIADAGWLDEPQTPLGIGLNESEKYRVDDGRIRCFVRFTIPTADKIDLTVLNPDDVIIQNNNLYLRCELDPELILIQPGNVNSAACIATLPAPVRLKNTTNNFPFFFQILIKGAQQVRQDKGEELLSLDEMQAILAKTGASAAQYGEDYPANMFTGIAVPLQSNILVYGPYQAGSSLTGRVNYSQDNSLVPWNYGSTQLLANVAQGLAAAQISYMFASEQGTFTQPGSPTISLGDSLLSGGPNTTSIDVQFGTDGVKTTYRMRSFTPTFGAFARQNAERLRRTNQAANALRRRQRTKAIPQLPIAVGLKNRGRNHIDNNQRLRGFGGVKSPHPVLIGEHWNINQYDETKTSCQTQSLAEAKVELAQNYANKHLMSLDGLVRPFKTGGDSIAPTVNLSANAGKFASPAIPPALDQGYYDTYITSKSLNFLTNLNDSMPIYPFGSNRGQHDILAVAHGDELSRNESAYDESTSQDYRAFALRGPLMMTGWGYDLDGKPVPNDGNNEDLFSVGFLSKPHTWPCGPIDLRWDSNRQVWCSHPGFKMVQVAFQQTVLPNQIGLATISGEPTVYTRDGAVSNGRISILNKCPGVFIQGQGGVAYYDTTSFRYWAIQGETDMLSGFLFTDLSYRGTAIFITAPHYPVTIALTVHEVLMLPNDSLIRAGNNAMVKYNASMGRWEVTNASCSGSTP